MEVQTIKRWMDTYLYGYLLALVLIMPLHAFLVISLGQMFGHQAVWQAWKEIGMILASAAAAWIVATQANKRRIVLKQSANWSILGLLLIAALTSALNNNVGSYNLILGAKTTLSFLVLFVIIQATNFTAERWYTLIKSLLIITSAVGIFAIAQVYFLPPDFLNHFGYSQAGIQSFHMVDPAVTAVRVIATFSGPNQLGSFVIIPLAISLWLVLRRRWIAMMPLLLSTFCLVNSYSRSAWIGGFIAILVILAIRLRGWWKLSLLAPIVALAVAASILSGPVKTMSTKLSYYVFHGQFIDGHENGSDGSRLANAQYGLDKIIQKPLGYGLGTAGPASNGTAHPIITENSYLQVGIETGVAGLALFGLTILLLIIALAKQQAVVDEAAPLIAILLGLCATNLFLHTWADSATALVFWGLAGYALAAPKSKGKQI